MMTVALLLDLLTSSHHLEDRGLKQPRLWLPMLLLLIILVVQFLG